MLITGCILWSETNLVENVLPVFPVWTRYVIVIATSCEEPPVVMEFSITINNSLHVHVHMCLHTSLYPRSWGDLPVVNHSNLHSLSWSQQPNRLLHSFVLCVHLASGIYLHTRRVQCMLPRFIMHRRMSLSLQLTYKEQCLHLCIIFAPFFFLVYLSTLSSHSRISCRGQLWHELRAKHRHPFPLLISHDHKWFYVGVMLRGWHTQVVPVVRYCSCNCTSVQS